MKTIPPELAELVEDILEHPERADAVRAAIMAYRVSARDIERLQWESENANEREPWPIRETYSPSPQAELEDDKVTREELYRRHECRKAVNECDFVNANDIRRMHRREVMQIAVMVGSLAVKLAANLKPSEKTDAELILQFCDMTGVVFTIEPDGSARISGASKVVPEFLSLVKDHKDEILKLVRARNETA